ncbi:hypothetical protein PR048_005100 [Dryococelus australis]|uniref:Uncharacterized protein n=1 Tax=Dryococelus australis TaxID=614101 RepID=A0ABQ9I795_9NEOP|nr:hypothetical protein PR048_005100 [Dryococelus australis]
MKRRDLKKKLLSKITRVLALQKVVQIKVKISGPIIMIFTHDDDKRIILPDGITNVPYGYAYEQIIGKMYERV